MEPPGGRESRLNLNAYNMDLVAGGWPSTSLQPPSPHRHMSASGFAHRAMKTDSYDDASSRGLSQQTAMGLDMVADIPDDPYGAQMPPKKSPPSNGKKTKGRVKIKMEYIENKLRRYTTFSKRKTGIMKKAYELSTLTGTQVMLLVASETGHVYTFATRKLQPMITSDAGKALIQTCLNSPDPPAGSASGDQRMSATGFEETELTYNISDEDSKDENMSGAESSADSSDAETADDAKDEPNHQTTKTTSAFTLHQQKTPSSTTSSSSSSTDPTITPSSTSTSSSQPPKTTNTSIPTTSTQPLISPLGLYQTPQGMMYAAPSNGSVIFGLAQPEHGLPRLIPLSVMAANGQGELDLSAKRAK